MVYDEPMPKWLEEELKQLGAQAPPAGRNRHPQRQRSKTSGGKEGKSVSSS